MFKRTLFRGANVSRVEAPMKSTVKVNAQALVALGRFVVEGSFSAERKRFSRARLLGGSSGAGPSAFQLLGEVFFAAIRLSRRRSFRERARFLGVSGCESSARRR